jgi:NTP pyrophosphatase (non-canonical NTP hydrolase)
MADLRGMTIYVEGKRVPLKKALEIITDEWIEDGQYCDKTVIDLKDALKGAVIEADTSSGVQKCVKEFALEMEKKLKANEHKPGWSDCEMTHLFRRLEEELRELIRAIATLEDCNKVISEAADVANFAMMVADRYKMLRSQGWPGITSPSDPYK